MSAQIILLAQDPDPSPFGTISSSMYRRKAARLSAEDKGLLRAVERKFSAHIRKQALGWKNSDLIRDFKESNFKCKEGGIFFFLKD
jgi:hypothetical protein